MKQTQTLIGIQQKYIEDVNAGTARWGHRLGHSTRIAKGARHTAEKALRRLGYDPAQTDAAIQDARDMIALGIGEIE